MGRAGTQATQGGDEATRNHSLPAPTWTPLPSLAQRTRVARAHLRHYHAMTPPAAAQVDPHSATAAAAAAAVSTPQQVRGSSA
jgi:hypothetical protein